MRSSISNSCRAENPFAPETEYPEIKACRQWYERELAAIKPALVVAMGATAAQSVPRQDHANWQNRGHLIDLDEAKALVTSASIPICCGLPDAEAKEREFAKLRERPEAGGSVPAELKAA
jgi:DNA polymerase